MSDSKPAKIDPEYPSGTGFTADREMAVGAAGAIASAVIPFSGPILQALVKATIAQPLEGRRKRWFNEIGTAIHELQSRFEGFDPARLADNEFFVSVVYEATNIAMKTHRKEKLEALKNVVKNAAIGCEIDEVMQGYFMSYIDNFSIRHLEVLRIFDEPSRLLSIAQPGEMLHGPTKNLISEMMVPATVSQEALERIFDDLEDAGMIATVYEITVSQDRPADSTLKSAGSAFLRFISEPEPL